jgi:SAM-dependent methyltransferase
MIAPNANVSWETAREANLSNWEERVPIHEVGYDIAAFDDPDHISDVVAADLPVLERFLQTGTVDGLDLCHLQCHIGTDTLSFARRGARVTGVDFSPAALRSAERLADTLSLSATWVESDVLEARAAVDGEFDVVYTSIGTITWFPDLDRWAHQIVALLKAGGTFYIRDGHPVLYALDEHADDLVLRYPYFGAHTPQEWDETTTYAGDGTLTNSRTYAWIHPLSQVVTALLQAGLRIVHVDEGRVLPWKFAERMIEVPGGYVWPEDERDLVPCTFTIVAVKD